MYVHACTFMKYSIKKLYALNVIATACWLASFLDIQFSLHIYSLTVTISGCFSSALATVFTSPRATAISSASGSAIPAFKDIRTASNASRPSRILSVEQSRKLWRVYT